MPRFEVVSEYTPSGDQPEAIEALASGLEMGLDEQTLLGVTGSGKTFTMAKIIEKVQRPTLVLAHNKTLAAQLCAEFREFFPHNAVEYFVSYYDYYQPEAYIPHTDTFIEKDSAINEEIDRLRLSATASLLERRDVIVVSSVSCIYGLGEPEDFEKMMVSLRVGAQMERDEMLKKEEIDNPLFDLDKIRGTVERPISVQTPDKEGDLSERAAPDKTAQDLYLFLESQLPANATKAERGVFRHMVEFLEPGTGLLPETVEEVAEILAAPLYVVERCLSWLHQMEPAGVGAATTSESLVLQAFHKGMTDPTLLGILFDHLEDVAAKRYRTIMRAYGLTMEEVQHYVSLIRTLEPYPTAAFGGGESAGFIVPDLEFYCKDGQWGVRVQDRWSSGVPYSSYYDLSGTDAAPELRTYLQEQHRHADYIVQCVEKRRSTLQQLGQLILNTQLAFLAEGQPLHTLTADMLAEQMGVNPSTVSRAIKGKYVKTPTKVYPLSYFLTRAGNRSGDAAPDSRSEILAALHKLLQEEDPVHPLSDAQLADQLTAQGITTTRRTVAKYRLLLGIPGAFERKQ